MSARLSFSRRFSPTTPVDAPRVLAVGDWNAIDFVLARQRLVVASQQGGCRLEFGNDLAGVSPDHDLILLAQSNRDTFPGREVDRLRRIAPLAALAVVTGSWCEGETRSGRPLPGIAYAAWHQFAPRWLRYLEAWRNHRSPDWSWPATWSEEERLLYRTEQGRKRGSGPQGSPLVVLPTPGPVGHDWIADVCRRWNLAMVAVDELTPGAQRPRVGVWQTPAWTSSSHRELTAFSKKIPNTPVLVVADFPLPQQVEEIRHAGGTSLLAQPLLLDDLGVELDWLARSSEQSD